MKSKLLWWIAPLLILALVILALKEAGQQRSAREREAQIVTLAATDLTTLGSDAQNWQADLETVTTLFESIAPVDESLSATEQVASVPPELSLLGSALGQLRQQAMENQDKAQQLAKILQREAQRPELFLPVRALAYTHLVLLARSGQIKVDESKFDPEVRNLAEIVLEAPQP